ncbi:hypothetical protein [Dactylosporangium salmoneum]|uniref:Flagellar hook-length control protein FliK n=1 Tax=Dactylosporangium salmoneum TaxID=53361 RepID=A0ABN3FAH1_9ACTN
MTRPRGRLVRAAAAAILAAAAGAAPPATPAGAGGTAGYCPDATGVTVVVDFHELGGGVVIRCAPGEQGSGLTALQNAGFAVAGTNRWGLAFICRIEGRPTAASEPCVDTPPATAYWSYWHASNGGAWVYSDKGVKNRTPPQGSFEGWSFSKNHTEGSIPTPGAAPSRPAPPPPPPPATTGQPAPGAPTTITAPRTTAPGAATAPGATTPPAVTSGPASSDPAAQPSAGPAQSTSPPASTTAPPADVSATRNASNVPAGTLAGLAVLVALAAAGGVVAWRRRTTRDT